VVFGKREDNRWLLPSVFRHDRVGERWRWVAQQWHATNAAAFQSLAGEGKDLLSTSLYLTLCICTLSNLGPRTVLPGMFPVF
jgi:hypothetical protein